MKVSNSSFTRFFNVEGIPWGAPGYTFSVDPFTIFDESSAEAPIGTI